MNEISTKFAAPFQPIDPAKFRNPDLTAKGEPRASVDLVALETLWINTGTLCNITCANCYIESSPTNDALEYMTLAEVTDYLDQLRARNWPVTEIAFTGGEPFMNPHICAMARAALDRGYRVLILTNAMRPMMGKSVQRAFAQLSIPLALLNKVLETREELDHVVSNRAASLAERPPASVRATKALLRQPLKESTHQAISREGAVFIERLRSEEAKEAFSAFFEKRSPDYSRFS